MAHVSAPLIREPVRFEVSCVEWSAFTYINGGTASWSAVRFFSPPLANAGHYDELFTSEMPMLSGVSLYLDEPRTMIWLESLSPSGRMLLTFSDSFPFASSKIQVGIASIQGGLPRSGESAAGTLMTDHFTRLFGKRALMDYTTRSPQDLAEPLDENAFCFFSGIEGRYFNMSDSAHVDVNDGLMTLRVTTPLKKDRNPGATVQCVQFDKH